MASSRISSCHSLPSSSFHLFFYFTIALFAASSVPSQALGALPEICGNGIDDDGTGGDLPCAGSDQDNDGFQSVSSGGNDCDDNDYKIFPGVSTASGCPAGQVRTCQSFGSFTSCSSAPLCEAGPGGSCKYIDCSAGNDTSGNGSFSSPWKSFKMVGSYVGIGKPSGWYELKAGDVVYLKGSGTCSDWYVPGSGYPQAMLPLISVSGSSGAPITIKRYPGSTVVLDPPFTSASPGHIFYLAGTQFVKLEDLELTGSYAATIYLPGGNNIEISRIKCHDSQGTTLNNLACINAADVSNLYVHHNEISNFYDPASPGAENIYLVVFFRGANNRLEYNRLYYTNSPAYGGPVRGRCFRYKHPSTGGTIVVRGNQFWNCSGGAVENSSEGMRMDHNLVINSSDYSGAVGYNCAELGGGTAFCRNGIVEFNTFVNMRAIQFQASAINENLGVTQVRNNIFVDNSGAYNTENGFYRIARYGTDTQYNQFLSSGALVSNSNCFYNPATSVMFDFFADAPLTTGAYYSFSQWQSLGYDGGSVVTNPALDGYLRATSGACANYGWLSGQALSRPSPPTGLQAQIVP